MKFIGLNNQIKKNKLVFQIGTIILVSFLISMVFDQSKMLFIFLNTVILWFTELIPLPVTALLVPVQAISFGILNSNEAFGAFGNQIIFLFIGSFLLARAMEKVGLDRRMAYGLLSLRFFTSSLNRLTIVIGAFCWVLSMWISNTATCAIMVPMILSILQTLSPQLRDECEQKNLDARLLLTCAFASSIGGMATPVGSPPNLVAIEFLQQKGIEISFYSWMIFGVPLSLIMLMALILIMHKQFPVNSLVLDNVSILFKGLRKQQGKIKIEEWTVFVFFILTVLLWILPGFVIKWGHDWSHLSMGAVALIGCLPLFIFNNSSGRPILSWEDSSSINWGIILLFGGGLCLGKALEVSGLAQMAGEFLFLSFGKSSWILLTGIVISGIILSEFSSNTASASILVPLILNSFPGDSKLTAFLAIAAAFGASFGFMLPVSTPPNAIVYGTGRVPLRKMILSGITFDVIGAIVISIVLQLYVLF